MIERPTDEIELEEETQGAVADTEETEAVEAEPAALEEGETAVVEADAELAVSFGDETPEAEKEDAAPQWVRDLRKRERALARENRELKKKLETPAAAEEPTAKLRKKPTLEDHDHYSDTFQEDLDKWYEEKAALERETEERERARKAAKDAEESAWKEKLAGHEKRKAELPVKGYQEAEERVFDLLDDTQRGILINYSDNSALLVYALAGNAAKLSDLAACKDPGAFIKAMTKLESNLKTSKRRPATAPESRVERGSAGKPVQSAAALEKLRAEADKTGNRSKVLEYMRAQRRAAK